MGEVGSNESGNKHYGEKVQKNVRRAKIGSKRGETNQNNGGRKAKRKGKTRKGNGTP